MGRGLASPSAESTHKGRPLNLKFAAWFEISRRRCAKFAFLSRSALRRVGGTSAVVGFADARPHLVTVPFQRTFNAAFLSLPTVVCVHIWASTLLLRRRSGGGWRGEIRTQAEELQAQPIGWFRPSGGECPIRTALFLEGEWAACWTHSTRARGKVNVARCSGQPLQFFLPTVRPGGRFEHCHCTAIHHPSLLHISPSLILLSIKSVCFFLSPVCAI